MTQNALLPAMNKELAVIDKCRQQLMEIKDLSSILEIRDKAKAIASYMKARDGSWQTSTRALAVAAVAEARAGQEIRRMQAAGELHDGHGDQQAGSQDGTPLLADIGITKNDSSRMQLAAEVLESEPEWFDHVADEVDETTSMHFTQQMVIRKGQEIRNARLGKEEVKAPRGKYDVLVVDPPWEVKKIEREVRRDQVDAIDYPTMTEDELMAMKLPAADDCHLWCWTTHKFLPMALRLVAGWQFKYVCTFVWHKPGGFQPHGLPQYNCEFAIYARRGVPKFTTRKDFPVCFEAPRGEHSEKPVEFYNMVRRVTEGKRLDMFSRRKISGFKGWGNEAK